MNPSADDDIENAPPSAKRRRTTIGGPGRIARPTSSGSAAASGAADNHTVALPYASFLSPTKASLARFNPALLPPPRRRSRASKSLSPERSPNKAAATMTTPRDRLSYVLGEKLQSGTGARQSDTQKEGEVAETDVGMESTAAISQEMTTNNAEELSANENGTPGNRKERASNSTVVTPSAIRNSGLTKSDDVFAPSSRESVTAPRAAEQEAEDDLPETPEKLLEAAKSLTPRGILYNSTPRRRKQREAERQRTLQEEGSERINSDRPERLEEVEWSEKEEPTPGRTSEVEESEMELDSPEKRDQQQQEVFAVEDLEELKRKREELDQLQTQMAELRGDMKEMRRHLKRMESHAPTRPYSDLNDLVSLINRTNPNGDSDKSTAQQPPTSSLLTSFLPFSVPVLNSASDIDSEETNPLPSHTPLPDTLQLITLFTPLTLTSRLSQPTISAEDRSISQTHTITIASPGNFLAATLGMTISSDLTSSTPVSNIDVVTVSNLSPWAAPELSAWLESKADQGDVPSIGYGLGRYWDVCLRRAKCWAHARRAFPEFLPDDRRDGGADASRKRKRDVVSGRAEDGDAGDDEVATGELVRNIGHQTLLLKSTHVNLRVSWDVELDWTGDVRSKVGARAAFLGSWYDADERGSLTTIPAVFDQLVGKHGVFTAIKVLVGLLFGQDRN